MRHGGGGRRGALRRDGGCGDGGMLLDIFSVEGEQGVSFPTPFDLGNRPVSWHTLAFTSQSQYLVTSSMQIWKEKTW